MGQSAIAGTSGARAASGSVLDEAAYQGLAGFRHAMRRFLAHSEAALAHAGVTSHQYQAMLAIRAHPGQSIMIRDLARDMLLQPHGAVQLVDRLAGAGWVERRQSGSDRRRVFVALTGDGRSLLERLAADHLNEVLRQEPLLAESLKRLRQLGG